MSLRLLPAIIMDNDEDDDGNFTKWMSSYWGHGAEAGHSRERKRSFRKPAKSQADRRASLPTASQLDAMQLNKLHAATMAPPPTHIKTKEEKGEARQHQRAHRTSSDDNSHSKSAIVENRITTIPELTESFEKRLFLQNKRTTSQDDDKDMCESGGAVQELQCKHRFHKEAARRLEQCRPRSGSEAAAFQARRLSGERRKSADGPIYTEKERYTFLRQLSLRRHR
ncbi:leukemia NUP98 fusion partner 1 [Channa argus]|uniref:leukemia NUP98 fusion partner 1 n=1 Tax=Channa argus TaxID=215402 RepID=UPI0035230FC6